jgi:hypothetical protein
VIVPSVSEEADASNVHVNAGHIVVNDATGGALTAIVEDLEPVPPRLSVTIRVTV